MNFAPAAAGPNIEDTLLFASVEGIDGSDLRVLSVLVYAGPRVDLLTTGNAFQVKRHGEDPRFAGGPLRAPANVLRDRDADVLEPAKLVHRHSAWRARDFALIGGK